MENITVFSNRLDESTGTVENVLEMKAKKTPWFLRFAPKAKGIVSFVQNLLSLLTRKESVRGAAVVLAGIIGLLCAPFESAQAQVLSHSVVTGVDLYTNDANDYDFSSGIGAMAISVDVFETSRRYVVWDPWPFSKGTSEIWGDSAYWYDYAWLWQDLLIGNYYTATFHEKSDPWND